MDIELDKLEKSECKMQTRSKPLPQEQNIHNDFSFSLHQVSSGSHSSVFHFDSGGHSRRVNDGGNFAAQVHSSSAETLWSSPLDIELWKIYEVFFDFISFFVI